MDTHAANRQHNPYGTAVLLMLLAAHGVVAGEKAATNQVIIDNYSFSPQTLTVPAGTKVTWVKHDDVPHTVLSIDKKTIVSPALDTDEKFSHTFTAAGTNDYFCSVHPHMRARSS